MKPTPAQQHAIVDQFANGGIDALRRRLADQTEGLTAARYDNEGGQPSDHSDPTSQKALRRHVGQGRDEALALDRYIKLYWAVMEGIERLQRHNTTDPRDRPTAAQGACLGGVMHTPTDDVTRCAHKGCAKLWPCREGETVWFEACTGTIDTVTNRCAICELSAESMVCARCGDLAARGESRSGFCAECRQDIADTEAARVRELARIRKQEQRARESAA